MQDPSSGVPPALLNHVHLVSQFPFAYTPNQLSAEAALQQLLRAPQVVRDAPVSWQYLQSPSDGTLLLAWQPINHLGQQFSTDGFVWASAETAFTQDVRGYTIEFYVNESGLAPQVDQLTARRRVRYRLIASPNSMPVDPALELVHYTASYPEHRIPARQVPQTPQVQKLMTERRYLEQAGPLERKQFMLHDRNNWPQVAMPAAQIPGNPYQAGAGYARAPQAGGMPPRGQQFPGQPMGQRPGAAPANRGQLPMQRMPGGAAAIPGAAGMSNPFLEELLKDEENHAFGDALDFVTPRDLSALRYKQHHEWMEEILSSPYEMHRILPMKLGLRLDGELKQLTEGLWNEPDGTKKDAAATPEQDRITAEQVKEFEKRVSEFLQKGEQEMDEMKRSHQEKMEEMSQQKLFANLERRLAEASDEAQVDQIIKEAEAAVKAPVSRREPVVTVAKGGILQSGEENPSTTQDELADFTNMDTAGEALDFYDNMDYTS